jgi:DNA-binding CsgD family transcriptional regulator
MTKIIDAISIVTWEKYWNKRELGIQAKKIEEIISKIPISVKSPQLNRSFTILANFYELSCIEIIGHLQQITGYEPVEVLQGGIKFLFSLVHPEDVNKVAACAVYYQEYIHKIPLEKRQFIKGTLNFRIKNANGKFIRVLEHVTPLDWNPQGLITHCLKHYTDISHLPFTDNIAMSFIDEGQADSPVIHTVIANSKTGCEMLKLSKRELEVLKVIANGKTTKEIADIMNLSPDTIKNHRKNMLMKTGAKNISEVLSLAFVNQIL